LSLDYPSIELIFSAQIMLQLAGKLFDAFLSNLPRQVRSQVAPAKKGPIRYSPVRGDGRRAKTFGV